MAKLKYCPLVKAWKDLGFDDAICQKLCDMVVDGSRDSFSFLKNHC